MLYKQLPAGTVSFGHSVVGLQQQGNQVQVTVEQQGNSQQGAQHEVMADLLVAADGSNSTIRRLLHPEDARR